MEKIKYWGGWQSIESGGNRSIESGGWQSARTLAQNVIILMFLGLIYNFVTRENILGIINQSLPPREAGLLGGILVGDKSGFESNFYSELKNSGLVHIVVVSGSNVMLLIGGWIESLAGFFGRKRSIVMGLILGWGYANLVGWEIPVVRAMMLMSIMYWAQLWGRKYNLTRGLILGVGLMMIGEITILMSVSFWMSMMAFLAVVTAKRFKKQEIRFMNRTVLETLWVSVWITPIIAMVFGKISVVSPITNTLVVGMVEIVTVLGAVATALGGGVFLWMVYPALKYLALLIEWSGKLPVLDFKFNWVMLIGWYITLFYFLFRKHIANSR